MKLFKVRIDTCTKSLDFMQVFRKRGTSLPSGSIGCICIHLPIQENPSKQLYQLFQRIWKPWHFLMDLFQILCQGCLQVSINNKMATTKIRSKLHSFSYVSHRSKTGFDLTVAAAVSTFLTICYSSPVHIA